MSPKTDQAIHLMVAYSQKGDKETEERFLQEAHLVWHPKETL